MEKIKFDYLLEHIELLNEMPKPATSFGPLNDKFSEMSPKIAELDKRTLGTSSAAKPNLFRKTVIGLYNDTTEEFKYTIPIINNRINKLVDSLFKKVDTDFDQFDIETFEDIVPNSKNQPAYDSAIKLAEAIVYSKYYPDFKSLSPDKFASLQIPSSVKKQLQEIMDNISNSSSNGAKLNSLLDQRTDMIANPDNDAVALLSPLDVVKFVNGSDKTDIPAVKDAFEALFVGNRREMDPAIKKRQEIINSPDFRNQLTVELFDYYRNSDRSRSSSAMASERIVQGAIGMSKNEFSAIATEVQDIIAEIKNLNKIQRSSIKKKKNPFAISPTLQKYKETGEIPKQDIVDEEDDDLNEYLSTVLSIWGTDVRKNIATQFDPTKTAFINSIDVPTVYIPIKAVNGITQTSYNLITNFIEKIYNNRNAKGIVFTPEDFQTKIIDPITALKTAPNEVEVLESIRDGLTDFEFGTVGSDDVERQIGGIENSVVRAVFDRPENEGTFEKVKDVIKKQLQIIEAQLIYSMSRTMAASDKAAMEAGNTPPPAPVAPQQAVAPQEEPQPVQESVFSYMEGQLQKDNKFKGDASQFKDRGFKKANNYWHWMNQ